MFVNHAHVTGNVWELPNAPMDIDELIPHIDSAYRTIASREGRTITGFSMGGGVAADLCARPGYSFDMDFVFTSARIIFDREPTVTPGEELPMRIVFKNQLSGTGPRHLQLRWILPDGWSVEGCKNEVYVPHSRPSIANSSHTRAEISFSLRAGEKVDFRNRIILEITMEGHPTVGLIPIVVMG